MASTAAAGLACLLAVGIACDGRALSGSGGGGGGGARAAGGANPGVSRGTGGDGDVGGRSAGSGGSVGLGGSTMMATGGATAGVGGAGADGSGGSRPVSVTDVDSLAGACVAGTINPGRSPLRRLTSYEYDNTVRDLVGLSASPSTGVSFSMAFPAEAYAVFTNGADYQSVSDQLVAAYMEAAEEIAAAVASQPGMLAPSCDPDAMGAMTCATSFIGAFGKKAFRRPLTADEVASYQDLFVDGSADGTFEAGIAEVIAAMLQSPHFVYRVELSQPPSGSTVVAVKSYEMATRLAYLVWGSMPDAALFDAADANQLTTTAALRLQVQRMVDDPRAHDMVRRFHREWLGLDYIIGASKSPTLFPTWNSQLAADLLTESETFVDSVFFGEGSLATLLTAPYSYLNGNLATHYGLAMPAGATTFVRVGLDPTQRAGILTQGAFLAGHSFSARTSPSNRGAFLRERILCQTVPIEPPGLNDTSVPDPAPANATTRQLLERDVAPPQCKGCHLLFDPLGFAFETFDPVGRWRATENGSPIDASGKIVGALDPATNGPFGGAVELMKKLATSADVRACVAANWFRWSSGRAESLPDDACSLLTINKKFEAAEFDMRALWSAMVTT
ncbi:MAG TPA: DUF1592 domain-containing protein, partial [Polyangia bacterium]